MNPLSRCTDITPSVLPVMLMSPQPSSSCNAVNSLNPAPKRSSADWYADELDANNHRTPTAYPDHQSCPVNFPMSISDNFWIAKCYSSLYTAVMLSEIHVSPARVIFCNMRERESSKHLASCIVNVNLVITKTLPRQPQQPHSALRLGGFF